MARDDDEEFSAFVASRHHALLRTAFLLTGSRSTAEDLVQTALTKTYLAWGRIERREAAEGYVRRTMVNTYTSWWRRHRGREHPVAVMPEVAGREDVSAAVERSVLWPHLRALSRGQRAVLVLRYYEDLTEAEIARVLGCSPGTVKSQASRALRILRERLGPVMPGLCEEGPPGPETVPPASATGRGVVS